VTSGRAVLVPGFFAGVHAMHEKFGGVPFAKLFDSGIAIANEGVYVTADFAEYIHKNRDQSRMIDTRKSPDITIVDFL
jgi:gamma-glutamyltranspeptidase/glutathione hydrolase